jgi:hypothetical protein
MATTLPLPSRSIPSCHSDRVFPVPSHSAFLSDSISEIESLDPKQYAQIEHPKSSPAPIHLHPKRQRRKWNLWKKRQQGNVLQYN